MCVVVSKCVCVCVIKREYVCVILSVPTVVCVKCRGIDPLSSCMGRIGRGGRGGVTVYDFCNSLQIEQD